MLVPWDYKKNKNGLMTKGRQKLCEAFGDRLCLFWLFCFGVFWQEAVLIAVRNSGHSENEKCLARAGKYVQQAKGTKAGTTTNKMD